MIFALNLLSASQDSPYLSASVAGPSGVEMLIYRLAGLGTIFGVHHRSQTASKPA